MRKRLIAIYSVLVVAIILLAALVPSCNGTTGTINVNATLCGNPWPTQGGIGAVNYTLTLAGGTSPIAGTAVPTTHSGVGPGTWTCAYVSGGPPGAYLVNITASATQGVSAGGTITFTLNFELYQDAGIQFLTWTKAGNIISPGEYYDWVVCNFVDVHFQQSVLGCPQRLVAVNEKSWLNINYLAGPAPVQIYAANNWYALNKTPEPPHKWSQVLSFNEEHVEEQWLSPPINPGGEPILLGVETAWQLVKNTGYTMALDWLGISLGEEHHPIILFDLILPPVAGQYTFILQASAEVELVEDEDVNEENNWTGWSPSLTLTVTVP